LHHLEWSQRGLPYACLSHILRHYLDNADLVLVHGEQKRNHLANCMELQGLSSSHIINIQRQDQKLVNQSVIPCSNHWKPTIHCVRSKISALLSHLLQHVQV